MRVTMGYGKHRVSVMMWSRLTNLVHKRNQYGDKYPLYKVLER